MGCTKIAFRRTSSLKRISSPNDPFTNFWIGFLDWVSGLVGRKRGVFAGLEAGLAVEAALEPRVVGGFDEGVGLGVLKPAVAGDAVEPAGELVGRVVVGHREALPGGVEDGGG